LNTEGSTGIDSLDALLGRGGIYRMAWTRLLSVKTVSLGGIMHCNRILGGLRVDKVMHIKRSSNLIAATITAGFIGNIAMGEAYISIILNCQLFKSPYEEKAVDNAVLSRSVEEGATLTAALIPWTTTGTFYTATLGIATLDYAPY